MKRWKGKGEAADKSEMNQLHFRDTFNGNHYKELTEEQKKIILESRMFLKENRDGTIKGISLAVEYKERDFISKYYSRSLTVATKTVLLFCIIYGEEERYVVVIDTLNAFFQTRVDNENQMPVIKIRVVLVDLLLKINPALYGPFMTTY